MQLKRLMKYSFILPYLFILPAANFLAQLIMSPGKRIIALAIIGAGIAFFFLARQKYVILTVLILAFFPQHLPGLDNTTNALIILLAGALFIRATVEKQCVVSFKRITSNPFFIPSLCIWLSYLIVRILALGGHPGNMKGHTDFFIGISCALLLANIIIGFVRDQRSLRTVQLVLLLLLFLNLFFGILFYFKPGLVLIPGLIEDQSVFASHAMRIGGLTFFWEAYAEYLMMAMVILLGLVVNRIYKHRRFIEFSLALLLLLTILELLLTNTRGPILLASFGSLLVIFLLSKMTLPQRSATILLFLLVGGTALVIAHQSGHLTFFDRLDRLEKTTSTDYGYMPTDRALVWLPAVDYIMDHGWAGFGPTMMPLIKTGYLRWPHNIILLILITVGLFGLCAYGFLLMRMILLKKRLFMLADPEQHLFFHLLWLAFLLFLVDTMKFDGFLRITDSYFYHIWISLGLLFSSNNFIQQGSDG